MELLISALFAALIITAMISDGRRFLIPNWISIALLVLFVARVLVGSFSLPIAMHVLVATLVFAVAYGSFLANWFGGGDVKLLTVVSLWAGPAHITQLLLIMSVSGMLLGLGILAARHLIARAPVRERAWLGLLPGWAARGKCPYGIAIGVGALAVLLVPAT